jgi:hypothetical protein
MMAYFSGLRMYAVGNVGFAIISPPFLLDLKLKPHPNQLPFEGSGSVAIVNSQWFIEQETGLCPHRFVVTG